jgi:hypothetical protein
MRKRDEKYADYCRVKELQEKNLPVGPIVYYN